MTGTCMFVFAGQLIEDGGERKACTSFLPPLLCPVGLIYVIIYHLCSAPPRNGLTLQAIKDEDPKLTHILSPGQLQFFLHVPSVSKTEFYLPALFCSCTENVWRECELSRSSALHRLSASLKVSVPSPLIVQISFSGGEFVHRHLLHSKTITPNFRIGTSRKIGIQELQAEPPTNLALHIFYQAISGC